MHRTRAFNQCIGCIGPNVRVSATLGFGHTGLGLPLELWSGLVHSLLIKVVVQSRHFRLAQWARLSIRWRLPRPLDHSLSMFITRGKSLTRVINIDMLWSSGRGSRHLMLKSAHWAECIDQWFARLGFINRLCPTLMFFGIFCERAIAVCNQITSLH